MFRVLQDINAKNADAMNSADVAMVVGMGAVKDAGEAKFPTAATAKDVFFVVKEFIPTGVQALQGEVSDYQLQNIAAGEKVVLVKPVIGEIYWTDQTTGTIAVGDYVVVGTDGKFVTASSGQSNLKVINPAHLDCGTHTGIAIEVVDWATVS